MGSPTATASCWHLRWSMAWASGAAAWANLFSAKWLPGFLSGWGQDILWISSDFCFKGQHVPFVLERDRLLDGLREAGQDVRQERG